MEPRGQTQAAWGLKHTSNQCVQIESMGTFSFYHHVLYNIKEAQSRGANVRPCLHLAGTNCPSGNTTNQQYGTPYTRFYHHIFINLQTV